MRRIFVLQAAVALGLATCLAAPALGQAVNVELNGQPVYFQGARPQMIGGRVMVPLRGVLEQLGAYVSWNQSQRTVTARRGATDIQMRIGDRTALVNSQRVALDTPATILQGTTMVPLRFMSEALGASVDWVAQTNTVRIDTIETSNPPDFPPYTPTTPPLRAAIHSFRVQAPAATFRAGDTVELEVRGTPGADVSFSIPGEVPRRMREESPGYYVASWTVPREAQGLRESALTAKLIYRGEERTVRAMDDPTAIPELRDSTPPTIGNVEPANGARLTQARPLIRARVSDSPGSGLNLDSWRLTLDGNDVTDQAGYNNGMITFQPNTRLSRGLHTVQLSIEDQAGNRATTSWQFEVTRDAEFDRRTARLTHDAPASLRVGDTVTFTVRAEPDSNVTYSIGNLIRDRVMAESSPGVYTARYTVRRNDDFRNMPVTARIRLSDGSSYTLEADRLLDTPVVRTPATPMIEAPTGSKVGESIIVRARSATADRFEVKVDYVTTVLGGLRLNGTIHQRTYQADSSGELRTDPINMDVPVGGSSTEYTLTVTAISATGERSAPATMTLRR